MSGAGRRTKYRKHVEQDILEGTPEPGENEHVVRVVASRGGNMLEVENEHGEVALCLLPAKFRKLVWVKRGNFLIATYSGEDFETAAGKGKVKYTVKHILFRDQIKHLNKVGLWPAAFGDDEAQASGQADDAAQAEETAAEELEALSLSGSDDNAAGLEDAVHEESDDEDALFVNPNRRKAAAFMDDSDSSDDDNDFSDDDGGASERAEADHAEAAIAADGPAANSAAVMPDPAAPAAPGGAAGAASPCAAAAAAPAPASG